MNAPRPRKVLGIAVVTLGAASSRGAASPVVGSGLGFALAAFFAALGATSRAVIASRSPPEPP